MDADIEEYGIPVGCMSGIALLPFLVAVLVIGGVLIWLFPWLIMVVIVGRIGIALWRMWR